MNRAAIEGTIIPLHSECDVISLFQKELIVCVKAFKALSEKVKSPGQYRIITNQFLDCLKKYEKLIDPVMYATKILQVGESLLEIPNLHYIAETLCLVKVRDMLNRFSEMDSMEVTRLKCSLYFATQILEFLKIVERDAGFQADQSMQRLSQLAKSFETKGSTYELALHSCYHSLRMTRYALQQNNKLQLPELEWILDILNQHEAKNQPELMVRMVVDLLDLYKVQNNVSKMESLLRRALEWFVLHGKKYHRFLVWKLSSVLLLKYQLEGYKSSIVTGITVPPYSSDQIDIDDWPQLLLNMFGGKWGLHQKKSIFSYVPHRFPDPGQLNVSLLEAAFEKIASCLENNHLPTDAIPNKVEGQDETIAPEPVEKEDNKPKKKGFKEDDDIKWKRDLLSDLQTIFTPFAAVEKFTVLVQTLKSLVTSFRRIKYAEKSDYHKDYLIQTLIEMGDALVSFGTQPRERRQHFEKEPEPQLHDLDAEDLADFAIVLYQYKQWQRLSKVGVHVQRSIMKGTTYDRLNLQYSLLIASAKFIMAQQSDRKVSFESNLVGRATPTDVRITMFDLTDQMKISILVLCKVIMLCVQNNQFLEFNKNFVLDSIMLIWTFMEPFLRNFTSPNEPNYFSGLKEDDLLLLSMEFIHHVLTNTRLLNSPNHIIMSIGMSQKLALIYECLEQFETSCSILEKTLAHIERARLHNLAASELDHFTADVQFLKFEKTESDSLSKYRKMFGCVEMDVQNALFRCRTKVYQKRQDEEIRQRELDELKLRHIKVEIPKQAVHKDELRVRQWCGNDPIKKALFNLTVIQHAEMISTSEKRKLLRSAVEYLEEYRNLEKQTIEYLKDPHSSGIVLRQKSSSFVLVEVHTDSANQIISLGCNLAKSRRDVPSTDICGTGLKISHHGQKIVLVLSSLIPNELYSVFSVYEEQSKSSRSDSIAVLASMPISLPLCWTYLYEIANLYDPDIA
jgi:hypothetical protein